MYTVNKKENGNIPINAFYAAAVSVMKREEATILMKIKAQNTRTEEDLFENIKNQMCGELIEKNENNGNHISNGNNDNNGNSGNNGSNNSNSNIDGKNVDRSVSDINNQNNENSLKFRTLNFLHLTLSQQRKVLISSLNHKTFSSLSKELKTVKNDRKNESTMKINGENNNEENSNIEERLVTPEIDSNNSSKNVGNNSNNNSNNSNDKNNRNVNSKKDKNMSTDLEKEKDSGSDSRPSKNVLLSCKYLLLVRD